MRMVLTNTVYFKGYWAQPFLKPETRRKPFYVKDKNIVAWTMHRTGKFRYAQIGDVQMLELPYLGKYLSMLILLPTELNNLPELEKSLTAEQLKQWTDQIKKQEMDVYLPQFKLETNYDLIPYLESMGIKDAFNQNKADFSGIIDEPNSIWLSSVIHHACIQVDEEGTKSAAGTGMGFFGGPLVKPIVFRADHPFVFLIRDKRTDSILFLGRVMEPQSE